jgi:AcrR family transcriptional regulator
MIVKVAIKDEPAIEEILIKAKEVFQLYGFKKTTMEDIARSMGKGKSTLYYYFTSKEDIFEQVVDAEMNHFFADLEKAIDKAPSAREKLKAYCRVRMKKIEKMCNLSHALRNDMIESMAIILEIKRKHETRHIDLVRSIFEFGVRGREFKKMTALETERFSNLFVTLFKGMELPACIIHPSDQQETTDFMVDMMIEGIGR